MFALSEVYIVQAVGVCQGYDMILHHLIINTVFCTGQSDYLSYLNVARLSIIITVTMVTHYELCHPLPPPVTISQISEINYFGYSIYHDIWVIGCRKE